MQTLYELKDAYRNLEALLTDESIPDTEVFDALDGVADDMVEKILNYGKYIMNEKADIVAIQSEIARLSGRVAAKGKNIARMERYLIETMRQFDIPKVQDAVLSIAMRLNQPKVLYSDEAAVPGKFRVTKPAVTTVDKRAIKAAIEAGEEVPGAYLAREHSIQIR